MNLTNYHSHCSYCDGKAPAEEFVKSAVQAGFTAYGISSHAPLAFMPSWTLAQEEVPMYLREVEFLKKQYKEQIELYVGMEIDYLKDYQHPADDYFRQLPLDYRIGSVHLLRTDQGNVVDIDTHEEPFKLLTEQYFQGNVRKVVEGYYEASFELVERGGFDFIGHVDKIARNAEFCVPGITTSSWYQQLREDLFKQIAQKGIIIEINTKAYLNKGFFYPNQQHFAMIKRFNIPVVVNSDAHQPEKINAGRREALLALRENGFAVVMEFHEGKWEEKLIDTTE